MISAILTTIGVVIAIALVAAFAAYGFFKIILGGVGMIAGGIKNGFDKIRK